MLRLVLLLLYLTSSFLAPNKIGGGLDPDGLQVQSKPSNPPGEGGGGNDPNGLKAQTPPTGTGEGGGGWDPDGLTAQPPPSTIPDHGNLDPNG